MAELMKGETFRDALKPVRGKARFEYPIFVEAKADEIRCRVTFGNGLVHYDSYAGKPLHNMAFLDKTFLLVRHFSGINEFDIGIEVNGNFNDSYRWVRSLKGLPQAKFDKKTGVTAPALDPTMVKVILFDLPQNTKPFIDRIVDIDFACQGLRQYGMNAVRPERVLCHDYNEVLQVYCAYRTNGLEGAMGKTLEHVYSRRRTFDWMKIKPQEDHDGKITGFVEAVSSVDERCPETGDITVPKGTKLGRAGSIQVELADGSTATPSGIPHALGRELWENQHKYVGQWIEFYCMERDRQGGYRHPVYNRFREDK